MARLQARSIAPYSDRTAEGKISDGPCFLGSDNAFYQSHGFSKGIARIHLYMNLNKMGERIRHVGSMHRDAQGPPCMPLG